MEEKIEATVPSKGSGRRKKDERERESMPGIARKASNATLSESETGTALGLGLSAGNGRSESPRSSRRSPRTNKQDIAGLREIYTLEFTKGDLPRKFIMHLPDEIKPGELIENIGGEAMSVRVPDDIRPGEKVILVASYPHKEEVKGTERQDKVCDIACVTSPMGSSCKQS